jgi:hypothetical protein
LTVVTVGKGDKASFWHSNWVNGHPPKYIALGLFQKAKRKNITVNKWISHVSPIQSMDELREFISLWKE